MSAHPTAMQGFDLIEQALAVRDKLKWQVAAMGLPDGWEGFKGEGEGFTVVVCGHGKRAHIGTLTKNAYVVKLTAHSAFLLFEAARADMQS